MRCEYVVKLHVKLRVKLHVMYVVLVYGDTTLGLMTVSAFVRRGM